MANWLRKLMPKEEKFFPLFNQHAEAIDGAAAQLRALLGSKGGDGKDALDRQVEQGRKAATHVLDQIRHSFVTPFDRSDIKEMTASMQSLLEDMQSVARSHANAAGIGLDPFGQLIVDCAKELRSGVALLHDFEKHADDLRRMRDKIADLRRRMLVEREDAMLALLTRGAGDAVGTLGASRLLQRVGDIVERFDEVADHIDDLVLDHV